MTSRIALRKLAAPWLYVLVVIGVGLTTAIAPSGEVGLRVALTHFVLALLTYPFGAVGSALFLLLIFTGIATGEEALFISSVVFASAGYIQWFVVFPRLVRNAAEKLSATQYSQPVEPQ